MDRAEFEVLVNPVHELYKNGQVRGFAYFEHSPHTVALGTGGISDTDMGYAMYEVLTRGGFNVEMICTALITFTCT